MTRPHHRDYRQRAVLLLTFSALLLALAAPAAAAEPIEDGRIWMLRQYRVPGCEPLPSVPTVFNWLLRKALAIQEFIAASADCGEIGRRGASNGWTYVFWSEQDDTAVTKLVRKAQDRYGLTQLVSRRPDEAFSVRSQGYEAFVMLQLYVDEAPARIWAGGDIARLEVEVAMTAPQELEVRVESQTYKGRRCRGQRVLRPDSRELGARDPGGPRIALPCQGGG